MNEQNEKKPLSERAARSCEEARGPSCHCRCGGQLHGGKRGGQQYGKQTDGTYLDTPREFFEQLPSDDPHYLMSAEIKKQRAKEKAEQKRQARQEVMERRYARLAEMEASRAARDLFW